MDVSRQAISLMARWLARRHRHLLAWIHRSASVSVPPKVPIILSLVVNNATAPPQLLHQALARLNAKHPAPKTKALPAGTPPLMASLCSGVSSFQKTMSRYPHGPHPVASFTAVVLLPIRLFQLPNLSSQTLLVLTLVLPPQYREGSDTLVYKAAPAMPRIPLPRLTWRPVSDSVLIRAPTIHSSHVVVPFNSPTSSPGGKLRHSPPLRATVRICS